MITFSLLVIEHPLNSESQKRFCLVHEIDDRLVQARRSRGIWPLKETTELALASVTYTHAGAGGFLEEVLMTVDQRHAWLAIFVQNVSHMFQAKVPPREEYVKPAKKLVCATSLVV